MKLIQILALATAMATMATAQNSSTNGQTSGAAKPSPTPASATASSKAKAPAKKTALKPAAATNSQAQAKPAAHSATLPGKPPVKTTGAPVKQAGKAPQSAAVKVKAASAPVVAAKTGPQATNTNKGAKPAVIAAKPAHVTAAKKTSTQAKKAPAKPATPTPKVTQVGTAAPEKPKPVTRVFGPRGRRDPFVSPIRTGSVNNGPSPNCTTGKRCLAIPELVLQGTVKDTTGKMLAVVANSTKKTYFLRENDQVFNGSVEKITSDSIIFREFVKDALGRETAREVVKKLVPSS
jgi:Tfp pilus assembly protein PilP